MPAPPTALRTVSITPGPLRPGQKSRTFSAQLVAVVAADEQWPPALAARDNTLRPVLVAYAAPEQQARAFSANLRAGRPAADPSRGLRFRFEIPRSAGFRFHTRNADGATLTIAYQPSVFALEPAPRDDDRIQFVAMPPAWWVAREAAAMPEFGTDASDAAIAAYFAAYLDHHCPLPLMHDPRFHLALYRAARDQTWCHQPALAASQSQHLYAEGHTQLGFAAPLAVSATLDEIATFLAEQTAKHFACGKEQHPNGKTAIRRHRRLLPNSTLAPAGARLAR